MKFNYLNYFIIILLKFNLFPLLSFPYLGNLVIYGGFQLLSLTMGGFGVKNEPMR